MNEPVMGTDYGLFLVHGPAPTNESRQRPANVLCGYGFQNVPGDREARWEPPAAVTQTLRAADVKRGETPARPRGGQRACRQPRRVFAPARRARGGRRWSRRFGLPRRTWQTPMNSRSSGTRSRRRSSAASPSGSARTVAFGQQGPCAARARASAEVARAGRQVGRTSRPRPDLTGGAAERRRPHGDALADLARKDIEEAGGCATRADQRRSLPETMPVVDLIAPERIQEEA